MTIPDVGPITATAIVALAPAAETFKSGRDFAAWLGLTPLQKSAGGKQRLGATSKTGEAAEGPAAKLLEELLRGANDTSFAHHWRQRCRAPSVHEGAQKGSWLARMLARKPRMLVTVALADKTARTVWALLSKGEAYRAPIVAA